MKRGYLSVPKDLADEAWKSYTEFGINIVSERDMNGHSLKLEVSYCPEDNQEGVAYTILREGENVKVKIIGTRSQCRLTERDRQKLLTLFQNIDEYEPPEVPRAPMIVTECAI